MIAEFLQAFVILFIIMDPFSSYIVFEDLTKRFSKRDKIKSINNAVMVAGALAFIFIFGGNSILDVFGVSLKSFTIVGGIVLFILGLEMILNFKISKEKARNYNVAAVIIATPITTGPGVITSVILFANTIGIFATSMATLVSLLVIWFFLRAYKTIGKFMGNGAIEIISKVMGLFIAARGIDLILSFF
jgi:multiple antibiotic resistance protein